MGHKNKKILKKAKKAIIKHKKVADKKHLIVAKHKFAISLAKNTKKSIKALEKSHKKVVEELTIAKKAVEVKVVEIKKIVEIIKINLTIVHTYHLTIKTSAAIKKKVLKARRELKHARFSKKRLV